MESIGTVRHPARIKLIRMNGMAHPEKTVRAASVRLMIISTLLDVDRLPTS